MNEDRVIEIEDYFDKVRIVPVPCFECGLDLVLCTIHLTLLEKLCRMSSQWYLCTRCKEMYESRNYWSCIITK